MQQTEKINMEMMKIKLLVIIPCVMASTPSPRIFNLIPSWVNNPGDFGSVVENLTDWSGLGKEWGGGDCTLLFISSSTRQKVKIDQPILQLTSSNDTSSGYHSNCFIPVLSTPEDLTTISRMDKAPSMVVYMGKLDHTNLIYTIGPFHGPLFEYFPGTPLQSHISTIKTWSQPP